MPYLAFLAPGLLAATAMQSAAFEATFPIMAGLVWSRVFHAMYATPIRPRDIALGNIAWIGARLLLIATVFTVVIVAVRRRDLAADRAGDPGRGADGLGFAAPIAAFSATQRTPDRFAAIFRFGITPLFLFSGTFYPVESLPAFAPAARLDHAAVPRRRAGSRAVARDDRAAELRWLALVHLAVLLAFIAVGTWATIKTVSAKLVRG